MATRRYDMHVHTDLSDGRFGSEQVIAAAARGNLDVIALTDHDALAALAPATHEVEGRAVRVIPGTELSGMMHGREYHFLVFFSEAVPEPFQRWCAARIAARVDRYQAAMRSLGLQETRTHAPATSLTRHHLARALIQAGRVSSMSEAFSRYLGYRQGHVHPVDVPFDEAISTARAAGGVTVWAHPPLHQAEQLLPELVSAGLQGIEVFRPQHDHRTRHTLRKLAQRHGLVVSGGSDWHGWSEGELGLFAAFEPEVRDLLGVLSGSAGPPP
ncbi:MAG: PHP domain-containing protein [Deltaproteobacteria bacterium]|nr:PHP domain-containing protein [Deltaproteobacteria bacterium]